MLLVLATLVFCSLFLWATATTFQRSLFWAISLGLFFWLGFLDLQLTTCLQRPDMTKEVLDAVSHYSAIIDSHGDSTAKYIKYEARIAQWKRSDEWRKVSRKAILYISKESGMKLDYGDKILVQGKPKLVENQKNPMAFDYGLYLQRKGFYFQDFISNNRFVLVNSGHGTSIKYWHKYAGDYLAKTIDLHIHAARERNVVKAMVLGRRNEITSEMEYVYQSTGTSHILAVSGLHVGIVYWILATIFSFLKRGKPRWMFSLLVFLGIWAFAFVTGLSPSVQRASTMFSFIIVSKMLWRKSNIYNTILASAFFILLFSPNLIFSVSFQLSYVAVLGIVFLYTKIYTLVYVPNRVLDFFWQITVLSVSVQIATFPITIFYFKQFPVLFAITNLLAIPVVIAILVGTFCMLAVSFFSPIAGAIAFILEPLIYSYNQVMLAFSKLPFALITDLYLKPYQVFLLMLISIFILLFLIYKKLVYFRYFTLSLCLFAFITLFKKHQQLTQEHLVFYHVPNKRYYDLFHGENYYSARMTTANLKEIYFNVLPYRKHRSTGIMKDIGHAPLRKNIGKNKLFYIRNQSVLVLEDLQNIHKTKEKLYLDFVVVDKSMMDKLDELLRLFRVKKLVFDSTVPSEYATKVFEKLQDQTTVYSIDREGALIIGD